MSAKKSSSKNPKVATAPIGQFFSAFWDFIKNIFRSIFIFLKSILTAVLVVLERVLQLIVSLILAFAKIIQSVAIAFFSVFAAVLLLALTAFLISKSLDLPASEKFQEMRERSIGLALDWLEPDFVASEARAEAYSDYRTALTEAYRAEVSSEQKSEMVMSAHDKLRSKFQEQDPDIFSWTMD